MTSSCLCSVYRMNYFISKYGMPPFLSESNAFQHLLMCDLHMPHEDRCQPFTAEEWPQGQLDLINFNFNFQFSFCCLVVVCNNTELMKGPFMSPNVVFYTQVSKPTRLFALSHHFIYQCIPPHTLITCSNIAHHHRYYNAIIDFRLNTKVWIFFGVTSLWFVS